MAELAPAFIAQFFDDNGDPLSGGSLETYAAGTTNPLATYTDQGGGTPNSNPITLDAAGRCNLWLGSSSYKFVLKNSAGVTIKTVDNVSAILQKALGTTKGDIIVFTSSGVAARKGVGSDSQYLAGASGQTDGLEWRSFLAPRIQRFTSGSGNFNTTYAFTITAGNATAGATYTNNGVTYTVIDTISAGTILYATGNSNPTTSGTLTKASGTGDSTLTFQSYRRPLYLQVELVGGGGGGGPSGNNGTGGAPTDGGNTTFGGTILVGNGGVKGLGSPNANAGGGLGGTASLGAATGMAYQGSSGQVGGFSVSSTTTGVPGGQGGSSFFQGAGVSKYLTTSENAIANSGSGGAGGYTSPTAAVTIIGGGGGGAGGYARGFISSPAATYAYAVGAGGTGGTAGTNGYAGSNGGSGVIVVTEHYQ